MSQPHANAQTEPAPLPAGTIRYLTPDMCRVHVGNHGALHVTVKNDRIYGGAYAVYAFPVRQAGRYVSMRHITSKGEDVEVGVIKDLADFPPDDAALVQEALRRHYFVHVITRIKDIAFRFGFVWMDVETDKGPANFLMRWQGDRAIDYGGTGKILLDVDENRYLIPDLSALSSKERADFQRFIYW